MGMYNAFILEFKYMEGNVHDGLHGDWGAKCALRHVATCS